LLLESLFKSKSPIIAALHLPPFPGGGDPAPAGIDRIERYARENAAIFVAGGVDALFIQDQTTPADVEGYPSIAAHLALAARVVRHAFPDLPLGIIANHHGARTPLAVAKSVGAQFVRLKVYVGAMLKAGGIEQGCAIDALRYRAQLGADDVAIFADVFDRTGSPIGDTTLEEASDWAARMGRADALILTGHDFESSVAMLDRIRSRKVGAPLFIGGGVTAANVRAALEHADGVIVSSALMRTDGTREERSEHPWDEAAIRAFVAAARMPRTEETGRHWQGEANA
jgi:membrane complex biogenesis BtpA family protein